MLYKNPVGVLRMLITSFPRSLPSRCDAGDFRGLRARGNSTSTTNTILNILDTAYGMCMRKKCHQHRSYRAWRYSNNRQRSSNVCPLFGGCLGMYSPFRTVPSCSWCSSPQNLVMLSCQRSPYGMAPLFPLNVSLTTCADYRYQGQLLHIVRSSSFLLHAPNLTYSHSRCKSQSTLAQ